MGSLKPGWVLNCGVDDDSGGEYYLLLLFILKEKPIISKISETQKIINGCPFMTQQ